MTPLNSLNIYVKNMPYQRPLRQQGQFLATSVEMQQNGGVVEYRLTFFGDNIQHISDEDLIKTVRKLHNKGLYKTVKKIISFIERSDDPHHLSELPVLQDFDDFNLIAPRHNFNFLI